MNINLKLRQILVPAASAVFGGLIVLGAMKFGPGVQAKAEGRNDSRHSQESIYDDIFNNQNGIKNQFDNIFNDDIFNNQGNPFEQMRNMREQMEKRLQGFNEGHNSPANPFDMWFSNKFGGGRISDISQREDDNSIYYDISVEDVNATSINTKVENGYITITGTTEKKVGSEKKEGDVSSEKSIYKSTFNRSFPLPQNVDERKMQMISERDKIILKFPKIKT